MSYTLFFLSSFLYGISLKDRLIYYLFLIAINICGEMISSSCLMFIFSFIFNVDKIFLDTILKTNQIYYLIGLISAVLSVFLVIKYIESISKNVANKQLKQIIKICFLPLVLCLRLYIPFMQQIKILLLIPLTIMKLALMTIIQLPIAAIIKVFLSVA